MKPERTPLSKRMRPPPTPNFDALMEKDPVEVYCRIRPSDNQECIEERPCISRVSPSTILLVPPEKTRHGNLREQYYKFKHVFDSDDTQSQVFDNLGKPLVEDLLNGKNGLLFAYGITGSGKTYTMEGTSKDPGIFRRTIDVIFKSISKYQTKKFIFKSDKMNGFDCLSEIEAQVERYRSDHVNSKNRYNTRRKDISSESMESLSSISDLSGIASIDDDNNYAIFVTYIQIYNKYVYDLLSDSREPQSKVLREDARHNMYIHDCTEIEVKSPQEAHDILLKGQKKRKVAYTTLNHESSRSHSVFTIRCVQAPLDNQGEEIIRDKQSVVVSQLSLVDLAGSERTYKTKATGDRLKETGNINNSLMALRQCIEILRENQAQSVNKKVPYRDCKLTHYFKNYLEGEGKVKMVVCVNPNAADYEETLPVMKFAELASEVQVNRATPGPTPIGLTPGRRKANQLFKEVRKKLDIQGVEDAKELKVDIAPIYTICPEWPPVEYDQETFETVTTQLIYFLKHRLESRNSNKEALTQDIHNVRKRVMEVENEAIVLRQEKLSLQAQLESYVRKCRTYECNLRNAEAVNDSLRSRFADYNELQRNYEQACEERDILASQGELDKQRLKTKLKARLREERERMDSELNDKLKHQKKLLKSSVCAFLDDKLPPTPRTSKRPAPEPPRDQQTGESAPMMGQKAYSLRHRRSMSEGAHKATYENNANQNGVRAPLMPANTTEKRPVRFLQSQENPRLMSIYPSLDGKKSHKTELLHTTGGVKVMFNDAEPFRARNHMETFRKRGHEDPRHNTTSKPAVPQKRFRRDV